MMASRVFAFVSLFTQLLLGLFLRRPYFFPFPLLGAASNYISARAGGLVLIRTYYVYRRDEQPKKAKKLKNKRVALTSQVRLSRSCKILSHLALCSLPNLSVHAMHVQVACCVLMAYCTRGCV